MEASYISSCNHAPVCWSHQQVLVSRFLNECWQSLMHCRRLKQIFVFSLFWVLAPYKFLSVSFWLSFFYSGDTPLVIAKGGFSGLFPDSSSFSYKFSYVAGSPDTISWCDVRLTKDGNGVCLPDIVLDNCTNIKLVYPEGKMNYIVNGVPISGWFSVDYDIQNLSQVSCKLKLLMRYFLFLTYLTCQYRRHLLCS